MCEYFSKVCPCESCEEKAQKKKYLAACKLLRVPPTVILNQPTTLPSSQPTATSSMQPSSQPSSSPSTQPTDQPTEQPTNMPSSLPSQQPSSSPSSQPSSTPSAQPTEAYKQHVESIPFLDLWDYLRDKGWIWSTTWNEKFPRFYKPGYNRATGIRGVSMFCTKKELREYILSNNFEDLPTEFNNLPKKVSKRSAESEATAGTRKSNRLASKK